MMPSMSVGDSPASAIAASEASICSATTPCPGVAACRRSHRSRSRPPCRRASCRGLPALSGAVHRKQAGRAAAQSPRPGARRRDSITPYATACICTADFSVDRKLSSSPQEHARSWAGQALLHSAARVARSGASCPRFRQSRIWPAAAPPPAAAAPAGRDGRQAQRRDRIARRAEDRQADAAGPRHQVVHQGVAVAAGGLDPLPHPRFVHAPRAARPACCSGSASSRSISAGRAGRRAARRCRRRAPAPASPGFTTSARTGNAPSMRETQIAMSPERSVR